MPHPFNLEGKTILITGASSGIGRACAIECSKVGASLILLARNEERLAETLSLCDGENHRIVLADVTDEVALDDLIKTLSAPVDGVVHAAGVPSVIPIAFATKEKVEKVMQVNALAPLSLTQKLAKKNKIAKGGSVVFISSINGPSVVHPGSTPYAMSKTAIIGLSRSLAFDLAPKKIRSNSILPGMIETPLIHNGALSEADLEADKKHYPLQRYGKPEEVAWMAIYLLSDASAWVTGTELRIDGGFSIA